jgi:polysaccharide export outer membrane protein
MRRFFVPNSRGNINIYLYLVLMVVFFAISCFGGGRIQDSSYSTGEIESANGLKDLNTSIISQGNASTSVSPADYLIGPADLLEIRVFESDKLTSEVRVSSRGEITLPLLGNVHVNEITARDAEIKIETLLKNGKYINDPHVSVFVKEYKSKVVSVVGNVNSPGSYELIGKKTIIDALAAAKGLKDQAGGTVYLTRAEENGSREAYVVYLDDVLLARNSDANLLLKPGDVVYVPEAGSVFVEGAVTRPGAYPIREGVSTVSQSIARAGGVASFADKGDVKLITYLGSGKREVKQLDLERIRNGEEADPIVKDKDAIVVGVSFVKRVLSGLRIGYFWGLMNVGYDAPTPIISGSEN